MPEESASGQQGHRSPADGPDQTDETSARPQRHDAPDPLSIAASAMGEDDTTSTPHRSSGAAPAVDPLAVLRDALGDDPTSDASAPTAAELAEEMLTLAEAADGQAWQEVFEPESYAGAHAASPEPDPDREDHPRSEEPAPAEPETAEPTSKSGEVTPTSEPAAKDAAPESAQGELWSEPDIDTAETAGGLWKGLRRRWHRSETRSTGHPAADKADAGADSADAAHDTAAPDDTWSGIEPETESDTWSDTRGESEPAEYEWTAADLAAGGWSTDDLRGAGWTDEQLIAVGWDLEANGPAEATAEPALAEDVPAPDPTDQAADEGPSETLQTPELEAPTPVAVASAETDSLTAAESDPEADPWIGGFVTGVSGADTPSATIEASADPGDETREETPEQAPEEPDTQAATPGTEGRETRADSSQASTSAVETTTAARDFEFVFDEDPIELETYDIEAPLAYRRPATSPNPTPATPQVAPPSTPPATSPGSPAATGPAAEATSRPEPRESTTHASTPADDEGGDDEADRAAVSREPASDQPPPTVDPIAEAAADPLPPSLPAASEQLFWASLIDEDPAAEQMPHSSPSPVPHHFSEDRALPATEEAPPAVTSVVADDSRAPAYVEYRPTNTRRWILGGLFLAAAVLAVVAVFYAVEQGTSSSLITAVSVIVLACALWWGLINWAPRIITISDGTLEVARGPNSERFDLTSPRTEIELGDDPRARSWTAVVVRPNGSRLVIRSHQVRPQQFTELVNRYRPAVAAPTAR